MSHVSRHEKIPSLPEVSREEPVDLNEQSYEDLTEFEDPSLKISDEVSDEFSGYSFFSDSSIETYVSPEISRQETVAYDPLMPVPPEDYPDMLFQMEADFPKSIHAYEHVRSLIKWNKIYPKQKIYILAPEGDYKNGIFFFSIYKNNFYGSAYCYKKNDNTSILEEALANSRYLPVQDQYYLCCITSLNPYTFEAVKTIFSNKNWCTSNDVILWLPWYCAREMEIHLPDDELQIKKLGLEHVDLINESWLENFPGSRELVGDLFDVHNGLGLFAGNSLLSWALVWFHGGIGIIQTIESEKGKGYCRPVVEALTKSMGECLTDVHLKINKGRRRDIIFFSALGFRYGFKATSCEVKKNGGDKKHLNKK